MSKNVKSGDRFIEDMSIGPYKVKQLWGLVGSTYWGRERQGKKKK